jgi:hypothetical protein
MSLDLWVLDYTGSSDLSQINSCKLFQNTPHFIPISLVCIMVIMVIFLSLFPQLSSALLPHFLNTRDQFPEFGRATPFLLRVVPPDHH